MRSKKKIIPSEYFDINDLSYIKNFAHVFDSIYKIIVNNFGFQYLEDSEQIIAIHARNLTKLLRKYIEQQSTLSPTEIVCNVSAERFTYDVHDTDNHTVIGLIMPNWTMTISAIVHLIQNHGYSIYDNIYIECSYINNEEGINIVDHKTINSHHILICCLTIERIDEEKLSSILSNIGYVLQNIDFFITDEARIRKLLLESKRNIENLSSIYGIEIVNESSNFIDWILEDNFTLLGYIEYDFIYNNAQKIEAINRNNETALGISRTRNKSEIIGIEKLVQSIEKITTHNQSPISISRSQRQSFIYKDKNLDIIGIRCINSDNQIIKEGRFIGYFTSNIYLTDAHNIPLIRSSLHAFKTKISQTIGRYFYDDMLRAFCILPREELFRLTQNQVHYLCTNIMHIIYRPQTKAFLILDPLIRFLNCIIFMPQIKFNDSLIRKVGSFVENKYSIKIIDQYSIIGVANIAMLYIVFDVSNYDVSNTIIEQMEKEITHLMSDWDEQLRLIMIENMGGLIGNRIWQQYHFTNNYRNVFDSKEALKDVQYVEHLANKNNEHGTTYDVKIDNHLNEDGTSSLTVKIYSICKPLPVSKTIKAIENIGFLVNYNSSFIIKKHQSEIYLYCFQIEIMNIDHGIDKKKIQATKELCEPILLMLLSDSVSEDKFNQLAIIANLNHKSIQLLRAIARYFQQLNYRYTQNYIAEVFARYPSITKLIVKFFDVKFDIHDANQPHDRTIQMISNKILNALGNVSNSTDHRILSNYVEAINAISRTNYHICNNQESESDDYMVFKFKPQEISFTPLPRPLVEVFVYSHEFEGTHLRDDLIARGGIRWSDRLEDFRTEILGLMKTQIYKNIIIVPSGAKGGFIIKKFRPDKTYKENAEFYYTNFLRGLLSISDNIYNGQIIGPKNVVTYDGQDPYLVVAADKGTATFSDIANSLSLQYEFWLGDAFASGGSNGYDHKKIAITSSGVWVSVRHHMASLGWDISSRVVAIIGIGDMSGDVFGNGLLLEKNVKLIAAFNHNNIFIDPKPNIENSYRERLRMFQNPNLSWDDYDKSLISKGGDIYSRKVNEITLSHEAQIALGTKVKKCDPEELIRIILCAPVDLLWNGGIGTFIKSEKETHEEVKDKHNDLLRVNGNELRCMVVGEGGNLGFTQLGRIEYSMNGGKINTDFIDNSGGVNCSDREVNIKIALNYAMDHSILDPAERNNLLKSMEKSVINLVLEDSRMQTLAIDMMEMNSSANITYDHNALKRMEGNNILDRSLTFLPEDGKILEMIQLKQGFCRPQLAILLSHSKIELYQLLQKQHNYNDDYFNCILLNNFPKEMHNMYKQAIINHKLKNEIISTYLINDIINRMGIHFAHDMFLISGRSHMDIIRAYLVVREVFEIVELWDVINDLKISLDIRNKITHFVITFIGNATSWILANEADLNDISSISSRYQAYVKNDMTILIDSLDEQTMTKYLHMKTICDNCYSTEVIGKIAYLVIYGDALNIATIALQNKHQLQIEKIAQIYFALKNRMSLYWLQEMIENAAMIDQWNKKIQKIFMLDIDRILIEWTNKICLSVNWQKILQNNNDCDSSNQIAQTEESTTYNMEQIIKNKLKSYDEFIEQIKCWGDLNQGGLAILINGLKMITRPIQHCSELIN